jgi:hypothetical protein
VRPASWLGGHSFSLLSMRSRVRFPVLPWEFYLAGEDPQSDNGLGSLYSLGLRPHLVLHAHTYHPSHHRDNVTAPYGRPTSEVGYISSTTRRWDHEIYMDMWWHWWWGGAGGFSSEENFPIYLFLYFILGPRGEFWKQLTCLQRLNKEIYFRTG